MGACEPTPNRRPGLLPTIPSTISHQPQAHQRAGPSTPLDKARPHGCENGLPHSGSLDFADTEEGGGSTPPAPTISLLTSAFVQLLGSLRTGIAGRGRSSGRRALYFLTEGVLFRRSARRHRLRPRGVGHASATFGLTARRRRWRRRMLNDQDGSPPIPSPIRITPITSSTTARITALLRRIQPLRRPSSATDRSPIAK
jgi:hypothetical protein